MYERDQKDINKVYLSIWQFSGVSYIAAKDIIFDHARYSYAKSYLFAAKMKQLIVEMLSIANIVVYSSHVCYHVHKKWLRLLLVILLLF